MDISIYTHDEKIMVVEINGEVDASTAKELSLSLKDVRDQGHLRIVVDVSKMRFISSAGIRALMIAYRETKRAGGEMRLTAPNAQVRRIFEITGVDELFQISEFLEESIENWEPQ